MPSQLLGDVSLNGIPGAASGSVRFYQPTTLIPVVVYSNDAATAAITQPIALDANGRSGTPIYVTKMVRMIVYDANGAQLQDVERADGLRAETTSLVNTSWPLAATVDALATALATSLGGTNGNTQAIGSGAAVRSIQAKLSERPSVKDYGAAGNGVTDDYGAFTLAIAAAVAAGGATIYIPAGTYVISQTIVIANDSVSFKGEGGSASIIKNSSASGNAISTTGSRSLFEDFGISHTSTSTGKAIDIAGTSTSFLTFSRLNITGHRTGIGQSGAATTKERILIQSCSITCDGNAASVCIALVSGSKSSAAMNNNLRTGSGSLGTCITLSSVTGALVLGNIFDQGDKTLSTTGTMQVFLLNNLFGSDVNAGYVFGAGTTVHDIGTFSISGSAPVADTTSGSGNIYISPIEGRWPSDPVMATVTSIATTSNYGPNNSQYSAHHVRGTAAGITITIDAPTRNPPAGTTSNGGAIIWFFFENTSGGAVTWAFNAQFRSAAVAPATGTGIGVAYQYVPTLAKWVEVARGSAV